jgi:hypothetical protein
VAKARRGSNRTTGERLAHALEQTFGVGIIVEAIDEGPPSTIDALVMFGAQQERLRGTGETVSEAWRSLGFAIAAWRGANDKHVTMWGGGF